MPTGVYQHRPTYTHEQRVERFIASTEPDTVGGCWLWTRPLNSHGYGLNKYLGEITAHRVSWRIFRGEIPAGLIVCHRCDVRCCVNPDHLFLGTHGDNARDCKAKGRHRPPRKYGEANPAAKLTDSETNTIRRRIARGELQRVIAADYGVDQSTVSYIKRRPVVPQ